MMGVDAQLLTGLWHACGRPCRSRAWRAASCELLAGLFSRENRQVGVDSSINHLKKKNITPMFTICPPADIRT